MISSLLFTPAARPDRFRRAFQTGASLVCLDLEDGIGFAGKDEARSNVAAFLARGGERDRIAARVNPPDTPWFENDIDQVARHVEQLFLPKVTSPRMVADVRRRVSAGCAIWPLIESAAGLRQAWEIASAPGVVGLMFGAFDYVADVGCAHDWEALLFARCELVAACAAAGIQLLDAPPGEINAPDVVEASTSRAKRLGFTGRACIHPSQVSIVNQIYNPSALELEAARRTLDAFEAAGGGPVQLDGRLIELPVARAARRLLARAEPP